MTDTPESLPSTATSYDVARVAGVSQSTVSRALRSDTSISPVTRERVLSVAHGLGYAPNGIGRSLVARSTRTIGMLVTDLDSPFYPHLVAPLHDELARLGYRLLLLTETSDDAAPPELTDRTVDGAVLMTTTLDSSLPEQLRASHVPFVYLACEGAGSPTDASLVDNALGASLMTAEVLRRGHRRVGAILGPDNTNTGRERARGLRVTLAAHGLALEPDLTRRGAFIPETGSQAAAELLGLDEPPTAIVCANDVIALGALNAVARLGLRVPEDVSIVGFDDMPQASWDLVNLTTVHQPTVDMARTAARLLVRRIKGDAVPGRVQREVFEPRLVLRRTLAAPAADRSPAGP